MEKGMYSKREMNLRKNSDLTIFLTELGLSLVQFIPVQKFFRPKILLSHRANTRRLSLWWIVLAAVRNNDPIRPESHLEWMNFNPFIARLAASYVCWVGLSVWDICVRIFLKMRKSKMIPLYSMSQCPARLSIWSTQHPRSMNSASRTAPFSSTSNGGRASRRLNKSSHRRRGKQTWKGRHIEVRIGRAIPDWSGNKEIQTIQVLTHGMKQSHDVLKLFGGGDGTWLLYSLKILLRLNFGAEIPTMDAMDASSFHRLLALFVEASV